MSTLPMQPDADLMKQVNRQFVTGVTVVTTMDEDTPRGLAVNAFANISLDPPTVMVCVQRTSSTHDCLFALASGSSGNGFADVVRVLVRPDATPAAEVVHQLRLPRILAAFATGWLLGLAV